VERHLTLLALLFNVTALLAGLTGLALLSLGLGATALVSANDTVDVAAGVAAATFLTIAVSFFIFGGVCFAVARGLKRHRAWARLTGIAVALINLFVPPFGTALGVYALWVLFGHDTRELFEHAR